jgi:hypothetical protein
MNISHRFFVKAALLFVGVFSSAYGIARQPVGLRCEFGGMLKFSISLKSYNEQQMWERAKQAIDPRSLYDAQFIELTFNKKVGETYRCRLMTQEWVWLFNDTPIRIEIKPNFDLGGDVYFYNVFKKSLYGVISDAEYRMLGNGLDTIQKDRFFAENTFWWFIELAPGKAITYPASSGINLELYSGDSLDW